MTGRITAFCLVKLLAPLWVKIFQYNSIALFFLPKLIINILVFCHWVLSKINTNSDEILNKFSLIFLTKGNQNKGRLNSFKVKNICIYFPLLYNFIGRGK
jgi:flagellar biosynthesis protein FliQ